ncbi:hypothetical protein ADN00_05835 [Ornatilinea apprima]|uniref:Glycerate kinase n=1 Tax=Ornatilinea apprima TaxID=1134406 RepID=A0A0P6XUD5_9CHLR|nr:DUF4147 domain-containing protein [Ornatilinea apprima]KPL78757.1 hypothetical protein ADN00_05835 [Ornatilinea apprima]
MRDFLSNVPASEVPAPVRHNLNRILSAALQAVSPEECTASALTIEGQNLRAGSSTFEIRHIRSVRLLAIGKAAQRMAAGAAIVLRCLPVPLTGLVISKHIDPAIQLPKDVEVLSGGHPVPDQSSLQAGRRASEFAQASQEGDLLLCLISGGGSALVSLPVTGVTLGDLQELTRQLLACGAEIQEINALRKHLDQVKGGGIARLAQPARVVSLILSDVIGNPLDVIASGPTVPDPSSFSTCQSILEKYDLVDAIPAAIRLHLQKGLRGEIVDTPFEGDPLFANVSNWVVGSNYNAAQAALAEARQLGFQSLLLTTYLRGEASQAGLTLASLLRQIHASREPLPRPCCLVCGGETTVTLGREYGKGGRNLELALGAVQELANLPRVALISLATDGEDGPTDAAGAVVTGGTLQAGLRAKPSINAALSSHNAYPYFEQTGGLIRIGSTGTNVNDLTFLFAW